MEVSKTEEQNFNWRSDVKYMAFFDMVQSCILCVVVLAYLILMVYHKDGQFLWALLLPGFFIAINLSSVILLLMDFAQLATDPKEVLGKALLWRNINIILIVLITVIGFLNWAHLKYLLIGFGTFQVLFRVGLLYIVCAFIAELKRSLPFEATSENHCADSGYKDETIL